MMPASDEPLAASQPPPIPKELNEFERWIGVFFSPKEAFADIGRRPRWWVPMIVLGIASVILAAYYGQRVGWDRLIRQSIEQSSRASTLSAEQIDNAITAGTKVAQVTGYLAAAGPAIVIVISAAVLMFIVNNLMGGAIPLSGMLGIVGYGFLPGLLRTGLSILVLFLKSPDDFNLQNPLPFFNASAFMASTKPAWLFALTVRLDLFTFWSMALMAVGIAASVRRLSFGKALAAVVIPWAVVVALGVGAAALFG